MVRVFHEGSETADAAVGAAGEGARRAKAGRGTTEEPQVGRAAFAARALQDAGCQIEEASPPRLQEAAELFFSLIKTEEKAGTTRAIEELGDDALRRARVSTMAAAAEMDFQGYVQAFARRASMLREWQLFFERLPLLLIPISYRLPLPIDFDQGGVRGGGWTFLSAGLRMDGACLSVGADARGGLVALNGF